MSLGIALVSYLPELPSVWWILGFLGACTCISHYRSKGVVAIWFGAGLLWATLYGMYGLHSRLPQAQTPWEIRVTGFVQSMPQTTEQGQRFVFNVEHLHEQPSLHLRKLLLSTYDTKITFYAAQRFTLTVRLKPPHGFKNRGGFDYEAWIFEQGIDAVGYVVQATPIDASVVDAWAQINVWRQDVRDHINQLIPESAYKGIIIALTIGDGYQISSDQWKVFNRTNTSHLIAISGLHISMIAAFCFALVCVLGKHMLPATLFFYTPLQKIAAAIALMTTIFYSLLTGMSIPTQRTLVMVGVSMLAIIIDKPIKPSYLFCIALLAVLLWDPLAITAGGFWLSFVAVGGLLFGLLGRVNLSALRQWSRAQCIIFVGLVPVMGIVLHQLSVIGPIANLAAIPVISFLVTPLCLLGAFLSIFAESAAAYVLAGSDFLLGHLWHWLSYLSKYDYASIALADRGTMQWALCVLGILLLMMPRGVVGRYWGSLVLILLLLPRDSLRENNAIINVLDVGQGLAIVVQTAHHTLVYDAGPRFSDKLDAGSAAVVPYLRYAGVSILDKLIISHADSDHSGGLSSILENIDVQEVITGSPEKIRAHAACNQTQHWEWDGVSFSVLWPSESMIPPDKENNRSCVVRVTVNNHAVLLTGDIEKPVEQLLVSNYSKRLRSELLIAPHHGSKTSSSDPFITAVNPKEVIFSSGYMSRFGHPHPEVVARYAHHNVSSSNTADSGGLLYLLNEQGITRIEAYRQAHPHYWDAP